MVNTAKLKTHVFAEAWNELKMNLMLNYTGILKTTDCEDKR